MAYVDFVLDRMHLSNALLTLQRHVTCLADVYGTDIWPDIIVDFDECLADESTGILFPLLTELSDPEDIFEARLLIMGDPPSYMRNDPGSELSDGIGQTNTKAKARVNEWLNRLVDVQDTPLPTAIVDRHADSETIPQVDVKGIIVTLI